MKAKWFRDCFRQVHMDFHMSEFPPDAIVNFNAKEFVDHLEHGKVSMVTLFAKCHFGNSFYNTKVGHKHSGLKQDFLMETASECRRRGIRTLAYYSLCWEGHAWSENPAWRFIGPSGQTVGEGAPWGVVCLNTPYRDELVIPQLAEIAEYPIDGVWMDAQDPHAADNICFCPFCKRKFQQEYGIELTPEAPLDLQKRFAMRSLENFLREVRTVLDRANPELALATNDLGMPHGSKPQKELLDITTWESQPHPGDYLTHSFSARTARNDIPDIQIMTVRFYRGWGDLTLKPTAQLITEFAAMIGNGAVAVSGDQVNVDGTLQAPVYDTFREAFGFVQEREDILRDADSVRHAVVLYPVRDPELRFDDHMGGWWMSSTTCRGAHKMLVESHIQADIKYSVLADDLDSLPMVILPEPSAYQPGMYDRLRAYVEQGGILVAAGNSLIENGRFQLEDVFGVRYLEPLSFSVAHFVPAPEVKGGTPDIPLQLRGQAFKVALDGARELAALHYPMAESQPPVKAFRDSSGPASYTRSPYSFATVNDYGKGKAVYIAGSIFDVYWQTNHSWLRQFIEAVLRRLDPSMPYDVEASGKIEANLMHVGDDLLLNLIHYSLGHQGGQAAIAAVERVEPVHNIACNVRCPSVERVVLEPQAEEIPFSFDDGICRFTVPEIEYLAMVRLVAAGGK